MNQFVKDYELDHTLLYLIPKHIQYLDPREMPHEHGLVRLDVGRSAVSVGVVAERARGLVARSAGEDSGPHVVLLAGHVALARQRRHFPSELHRVRLSHYTINESQ